MDQDGQKYIVGQRVKGRVEKVLRYGLFVCLGDGTQAYIRRRELSWASNIDPQKTWRTDDEVEAVVLKLASGGYLMELSHRQLLPDPWDDFEAEYHQGDVVEGIVKNLMGHGIYVEIKPGVDGLIPLSELATWEVQKPEEEFWIGDTVEALITHLNRRTKKLRLSIRARLRQLEVVTGIMVDFDLLHHKEDKANRPNETTNNKINRKIQSDSSFGVDIDPSMPQQVGRILVVDDHDEVRLPLVEWLQHHGYDVDEAKDAYEAIKKVLKKTYGLLIVDLNLPGIDGLTFLKQIRQKGINCPIAITSTADWIAERSCEIEEVGVIEVLVKPLDLDEINQLLIRVGHGETLPIWQGEVEPTRSEVPGSFQQMATDIYKVSSLAEKLHKVLEELVATTAAEMGLIFKIDPVSKIVSISAHVGGSSLNTDAIHALNASPVRDVIEDGEQILEYRMSGSVRERFRKLLDLLSFESCIGVPIKAIEETYRAVFLFHREANKFNRYHLRDTLAASALFSVVIEREIMENRFRSLNKQVLNGQLAGGFSHEIYNKMSGLELQLHNLQLDCRTFDPETSQPIHFNEIQQAVGEILTTFGDMKETVDLFQQLTRSEGEQCININEVVRKAVYLLRPTMQSQRVRIETELSDNLPDLIGNSIQLQQVFFNIMLNATQQMALKPGQGKILTVTTSYQDQDEDRPIKIRISDMGPGIHRRLQKKIFDLGFTTRANGTGQGLYIARSLVDVLGGKIYVEKSCMLIGTTFLVELPAHKSNSGETK